MSSSFAPGQCWALRSGEAARVIVGAITEHGPQVVVHVAIVDATVPEDIAPGGRMITISHAPFTEEALAMSVAALTQAQIELPDAFARTFREWRYEDDRAYDVSVAYALESIFDALRER